MSPQYDTFRVCGCSCFPNIRDSYHRKLQFRSVECTFIVYSLNYKDYKCLAFWWINYYLKKCYLNEKSSPLPDLWFSYILGSSPTILSTTKDSSIPPCPNNIDQESSPFNPSNFPQDDQWTELPPKPINTDSIQTRAKPGIYNPKVFSNTKEPNLVHASLQQKH